MTVQTGPRTTEKPKSTAKRKELQPVTPHLVCAGAADAIDFYKNAFDAVEMMRLPGKDGRLMHAAIQIGGASVMLVDEMPEWGALSPKSLKGTPVTIHLYVEDVDAFVDRAVKAGATLKMPVADMFWGDRYGVIVDPFGHSWSVATHQRDMTAEEIQDAVKNMPPCGEAAKA
jgi:PhnB protein